MRFGELIRRSRLERGWSQSRLAERLGVTQRYISAVERGEADNPTLGTICTFARTLGLKFYELKPVFACALVAPNDPPLPRREDAHG